MSLLFVTKPFAPPWHDSSSGLARALVHGLLEQDDVVTLRVMVGDHPSGFSGLVEERIYSDRGAFAPGLRQNLPVLLRLFRHRNESARHFFFAPNPRTAIAARLAARFCRRPSIHTLCSLPSKDTAVRPSLFADQPVVVSPWAQRRLEAEGVETELIEPAVLPLASSEEGREGCRKRYGDYVLFAGDLRAGGGVDAALDAFEHFPSGLNLVLACRAKTAADHQRKMRIEERIKERGPNRIFLLGRIDWIGDLVSAARAQLLPATDLTGKMDWPLVLLEGFAAGVPAVTARHSPMADLSDPSLGVASADDASEMASEVERVIRLGRDQVFDLYRRRFTPKRLADDLRRVYRSMGLM